MAVEFILARKPQRTEPILALFEASFSQPEEADDPAFPAWIEADWKATRPPRGKSAGALRLRWNWDLEVG